MTLDRANSLAPGDRIQVQLRLDHEIAGTVLSTSPNGVYIEWDDMDQPTFEPRTKLLRANWAAEAR